MNDTANVNEEKKQRVLQVIKETGFKPNEAARSLYKKSARIISLIVPNIDNPFFNEMVKAIEDEVYKHDYRLTPNEAARSLYKKSARIISLIVPNIDNPFFNEMVKAIEDEVYKHDYRLTLCNSNNDIEKELHNIELLTRMNADGIILLTSREELVQKIDTFHLPVVMLDRELSSIPDVTCPVSNQITSKAGS